MQDKKVRVRYAPSPTGVPHVGNIRTALFNWLFARHNGGRLIVRIEDTDQARTQTGAIEAILESLRWLDLDWDEGPEVGGDYGPYLQSERLEIYDRYAQQLLDSGAAYHCYCSAERLKAVRDEQSKHKQNPRYDGRCRDVPEQQAKAGGDADLPVVRFRVPEARTISFNDRIRDQVSFESDELGDFVLIKTDRFPTYHMANVVDDHLMEISHVLRAEEWLSSTPRHLLLYEALGMTPPDYGHLPIILGPDRSKLSKRHGAAALLDYRDLGFLPDAMVNYLALMGWALDDHTELFTREMLVKHFTLERVGKSGAIFDITKLAWMNGVKLREMSPDKFMEVALSSLESGLPQDIIRPLDQDYAGRVLSLLQERTKTLKELPELAGFFFVEDLSHDPKALVPKKMDHEGAVTALKSALAVLTELRGWDVETLEGALRPLAPTLGIKTGQLFGALRVGVTGRMAAPPLFDTMAVLGRDRCMDRLKAALEVLESAAGVEG